MFYRKIEMDSMLRNSPMYNDVTEFLEAANGADKYLTKIFNRPLYVVVEYYLLHTHAQLLQGIEVSLQKY